MINMNLQYFGGRGSAGGNNPESSKVSASAESAATSSKLTVSEPVKPAVSSVRDVVRSMGVSTGQYIDEKDIKKVENNVGSLLSAMEIGDKIHVETTSEAEVSGEYTDWGFEKTKSGFIVTRDERVYAAGRFQTQRYEEGNWNQKNVVSQIKGAGGYNIAIYPKGEYRSSVYWEYKKRK